jgi:hypothetical protein
MKAKLFGVAVFLFGTLSCTSSKPTPPAEVPAVVKRIIPKDESGKELTEPEIVRSKQVQIDNRGIKTITVGNANGDYALSCNMKADYCLTPVPGKGYYVFNKTSKWKMPGATSYITLAWLQDWAGFIPEWREYFVVPM